MERLAETFAARKFLQHAATSERRRGNARICLRTYNIFYVGLKRSATKTFALDVGVFFFVRRIQNVCVVYLLWGVRISTNLVLKTVFFVICNFK